MATINGLYGVGYSEVLNGTTEDDTIDSKGGGDRRPFFGKVCISDAAPGLSYYF